MHTLDQLNFANGPDMVLLGPCTPYGSFPVTEDGYTAGPSVFEMGSGVMAPTTVGASPFAQPKDHKPSAGPFVYYFEVCFMTCAL